MIWHNEIPANANGIGDKLDYKSGNVDGRVSQGEKHVNSTSNCRQNQANDPCTDGVARQVLIIVSDGSAHLIGR